MSRADAADGAAYYAENYPDYAAQNPARKLDFYRGILRRHVQPGARLFELGVGLGLFLESVHGEYECAGCDVNAFGLEQTRKRTGLERLHLGSVETLDREPALDAVVAWDVLEHLPDLDSALRTVHARLADGGYLIGVVPVYDGPLGWLVRLLDRDPSHVTKQSRHFWLRKLTEAGFELREWGGILRKLTGSYYVHLTWPQPLLRRAGSAVYFVTRKTPDR
ncbi:MAG TPA: methyltransferase domain-containing protein [Thermoanaerobaculia bacterium]|jgi:SAM-dependent methyltransferase|nr:methyltransferase domain-containing protein [Thermoanaerobaculia bacterium]